MISTWKRYMHGGAESGFRRVKPEQYKPRLFHFHGDKRGVMVKEASIFINQFLRINFNQLYLFLLCKISYFC